MDGDSEKPAIQVNRVNACQEVQPSTLRLQMIDEPYIAFVYALPKQDIKSSVHSYRSDLIGLASAALMVRKLTVARAMIKAMKAEAIKVPIPILIRLAYS